MKLSRRSMLALAGAGAALGGTADNATAQTPPAAPKPDPLTAAREDNRRSAETLAKFEIPTSTEPAFVFRA
jgi:hypothetical protein